MGRRYDAGKRDKATRLRRAARLAKGKVVAQRNTAKLLAAVIRSGDRLCIEGDNQKQADFLADELLKLSPNKVRDLHLVMSCLALPQHIALFRKGLAKRVDFAFAGPQSATVAQMLTSGKLEVGAIHTYNELYARYYVDLILSDSRRQVSTMACYSSRPVAGPTTNRDVEQVRSVGALDAGGDRPMGISRVSGGTRASPTPGDDQSGGE